MITYCITAHLLNCSLPYVVKRKYICVLYETHTGLLLFAFSMLTMPSIKTLSLNFTVCSPTVIALIDMDAFLGTAGKDCAASHVTKLKSYRTLYYYFC